MKMSKEKTVQSVNKLVNALKPDGVIHIESEIDPVDIHGDEYYIRITYVVPNDSKFLNRDNIRNTDFYRNVWNRDLTQYLKNYLGVNVILSSSSINSESYHNRLKQH
jgi:hypothetical protein